MSGWNLIYCDRPKLSGKDASAWDLLFFPAIVAVPFIVLAFAGEIGGWFAAAVVVVVPNPPDFLVFCFVVGGWLTTLLGSVLCLAALREKLVDVTSRRTEGS